MIRVLGLSVLDSIKYYAKLGRVQGTIIFHLIIYIFSRSRTRLMLEQDKTNQNMAAQDLRS